MTNKKFDKFGNYLRFPGFTVVADVFKPNQDVFQAIFDKLKSNALLLEYNALLPVESYHITQFSIISQKTMTDDQWHNWFKSQAIRLRATHRELESGTNPFSFRIVGVDKRRITFLVEVSEIANGEQKEVADRTGKISKCSTNGLVFPWLHCFFRNHRLSVAYCLIARLLLLGHFFIDTIDLFFLSMHKQATLSTSRNIFTSRLATSSRSSKTSKR